MSADACSLPASCDPQTGQVYVPPRRFAADGSLRECEQFTIDAEGNLASCTEYRGEFYGLVDLAHSVRIQVLLGPGPHSVGAHYRGTADASGIVRFNHA